MRADASQPAAASLRFGAVSDERLVARLRGGDSRAFEAIYDRYERPIRSFCRHMLGQPEDADDAAQHTFLAAYRELVGSDKAIELRPWLFTVARNRCRTLLRARYRGMAFSEPMEYEPSVEGLAVEVERREHLRDLMRDISRLPEDQRAALLLTQLETLRHDEVARVLDVPADKVKALVFQARSSLVASELARDTPCREIREQLATLSGAGLRRRTLRRHVRDCQGCREFEQMLRRQRHAILLLLPVAASPVVRDALAAQLAGGAAGGAAAGGMAAGGGSAAGGGLSALVSNALAVKTATVLSVAAAGAGAVAVTVGVRAAGSVYSHSSGRQSATGTAAIGNAPRPVYQRVALQTVSTPVHQRRKGSHHGAVTRTRSPGHAPRQETVARSAPSAGAPSATVPVSAPAGDSAPPPGRQKDKPKGDEAAPQAPANPGNSDAPPPGQTKKEGSGSIPPDQAKKEASNSQPPGQAKKQESGSLPPGQAKKEDPQAGASPTTGPGNSNGNGNANGNGYGDGSAGNGNGNGHGGANA